jgi:hypothetical protein
VAVTLGFRSPTGDHLPNRVNVERSPRGIARGLSTLGCAIDPSRPGSPDRTWPAVRRVPPRIALDGTGVDPDRIDAPDLDTEIVVPPEDTLRWLYPTAGLLYYLGATATVADDAADARLREPERSDSARRRAGRQSSAHCRLGRAEPAARCVRRVWRDSTATSSRRLAAGRDGRALFAVVQAGTRRLPRGRPKIRDRSCR